MADRIKLAVETGIGPMRVWLIDDDNVLVITDPFEAVTVRNKRYTVRLRFRMVNGQWKHVPGDLLDRVLHEKLHWIRRGIASKAVKAQVIEHAQAAVAQALAANPDTLGQVRKSKARQAVAEATAGADKARAALAEAQDRLALAQRALADAEQRYGA